MWQKAERYVVITLLVLLAVVLGGSMVLAGTYHFMAGTAAAGVRVLGEDMGGMSAEEVGEYLRQNERLFARQNIKVELNDEVRTLAGPDLGIELDVEGMTEEVMARGNRGNLLERLQERYRLNQNGEDVPLVLEHEEELLEAMLDEIGREVEQEPESARFEVENQQVQIIPSQTGLVLDREESARRLLDAFATLDQNAVETVLVEEEPEYTTEELEEMGIDHLRAQFSTNFNPGETNRNHNIRLATEPFQGQILEPGEVISFNEVVGPRTGAAGFRQAPVIVDGELEPGMGGGICQPSSTLYNVGLLGNLEIEERWNHSLPVSYLPVGRDATVVYGGADVKLKNSLDHPVLFWSYVTSNSVTFELYGQDTGEEIDVVTEVVSTLSPGETEERTSELPRGEKKVEREGRAGYVVNSARIITYPDGSTEREFLAQDRYQPRDRKVLVGTGEPETRDNGNNGNGREPADRPDESNGEEGAPEGQAEEE